MNVTHDMSVLSLITGASVLVQLVMAGLLKRCLRILRHRWLDDTDTAATHAQKWRDAGYGYLVCGWPGEGDRGVERFARDVMPAMGD